MKTASCELFVFYS